MRFLLGSGTNYLNVLPEISDATINIEVANEGSVLVTPGMPSFVQPNEFIWYVIQVLVSSLAADGSDCLMCFVHT